MDDCAAERRTQNNLATPGPLGRIRRWHRFVPLGHRWISFLVRTSCFRLICFHATTQTCRFHLSRFAGAKPQRSERFLAVRHKMWPDVAMGDSRWPKINCRSSDSTWMRRSLASGSRARASHASRARAGRSRQRQSKWAGSTRRCTRTALVTAPFLFGTIPAFSALPCGYLLFPLGLLPPFKRIQGAPTRRGKPTVAAISNPCPVLAAGTTRGAQGFRPA
jgi:hypothetical protein